MNTSLPCDGGRGSSPRNLEFSKCLFACFFGVSELLVGKDSKVVIGTTKIGGRGHGFRASQDLNLNDPQRDIRDKVNPYSIALSSGLSQNCTGFAQFCSSCSWEVAVMVQQHLGVCGGVNGSTGGGWVEVLVVVMGVGGGVGAGSGESAMRWWPVGSGAAEESAEARQSWCRSVCGVSGGVGGRTRGGWVEVLVAIRGVGGSGGGVRAAEVSVL